MKASPLIRSLLLIFFVALVSLSQSLKPSISLWFELPAFAARASSLLSRISSSSPRIFSLAVSFAAPSSLQHRLPRCPSPAHVSSPTSLKPSVSNLQSATKPLAAVMTQFAREPAAALLRMIPRVRFLLYVRRQARCSAHL